MRTIGFTLNPASDNPEATAEEPTNSTEAKTGSPAVPPAPTAVEQPNSAFYFLSVEFNPRGAGITEQGVAEHIYHSIIGDFPFAVYVPGTQVSQVVTPVRNDKWSTVKPIIDKFEKDFQLDVIRFDVESVVPQIAQQQIINQQQQAAQALQKMAAQPTALGSQGIL
jgi:hypothetical protein